METCGHHLCSSFHHSPTPEKLVVQSFFLHVAIKDGKLIWWAWLLLAGGFTQAVASARHHFFVWRGRRSTVTQAIKTEPIAAAGFFYDVCLSRCCRLKRGPDSHGPSSSKSAISGGEIYNPWVHARRLSSQTGAYFLFSRWHWPWTLLLYTDFW